MEEFDEKFKKYVNGEESADDEVFDPLAVIYSSKK